MDGVSLIINNPQDNREGGTDTHKFSYDKAFAPHMGQEEVFAEVRTRWSRLELEIRT